MSTLARIIDTVAETAPDIRAGLTGRRTYEAEENPSGEAQLAADLYADDLISERLLALSGVATYASEERDEIDGNPDAPGYHIACDPLDGSSNLKSNNTMGTILGVYDAPIPASGHDLVAAAYVLFGPITTMIVAADDDVTEYVIEGGEKRVVREDITIPEEPVTYGFGGRVPEWTPAFTAFAREIEQELKLRYGGAMIGDVNQVLTYGGIFAYPGLRSHIEGKLRLQFEGNPIAYIVEAAGGRSSDGTQSLLSVEATALHQRVPVHVGNETLIDRLEAALAD